MANKGEVGMKSQDRYLHLPIFQEMEVPGIMKLTKQGQESELLISPKSKI